MVIIGQDGVIKNRETYEIIDPKQVGADDSQIILTARSGRAALNYRAAKMNVKLTKEKLEVAYQRFLTVADRYNQVDDNQLMNLLNGI